MIESKDKPEPKESPPDPYDAPSGGLLAEVQNHAELFVDDLIEFGRDQIVMVTISVEFGNGTTLKYERDDFAGIVFTEADGDDDDDD